MKKGSLQSRDRAKVARNPTVHAAVERVTHDRVPDRAQVHTNLMRPTGVDRYLRQRQGAAQRLGSDDARDRFAAAPRPRRHLLSVLLIPPDWGIDAAACQDFAPDQCDVLFLDLTVVELARKFLVRGIVFRHNHQPRRATVQAVNDARPLLAADAAEIVDVVQQRVDERAATVTGRRMHDHSRGLVDNEQVLVLEDDG